MAEHPIQMTPAELSATTLVRVAEKCESCAGTGWSQSDAGWRCQICLLHRGCKPSPYEVGDVLLGKCTESGPTGTTLWLVRRTVTSVELVRLQEMDDDAITEWSGTDWTWPENVDTDGEFYTAEQRLERDRERCEERWDDANPEHPWASNPHVWKIGVEGGEKNG